MSQDVTRTPVLDSTPRIRVLIVASTLHVGGAEMVIAELGRHLDRSRFDVLVCFLRENGVIGRLMAGDGVELVAVPGHKSGKTDYLTSFKLRRLVRERRIQIVHSHDPHGLIDCSIVRCLAPGLRHVHTFHFGNYPNLERGHARFERLTWRRPDRLVAVGEAQARAIAKYHRMNLSRLHVLRNGVVRHDPIIDASVQEAVAAGSRPIVASISTLTKQKGLFHLLEAAALMVRDGTNFVLVLAGDGSLRAELQRHAEALGVTEHVRFLGWVPEASRRVLPMCDVFVQSSLWEAMSIVVLEAMAARKAMVVTGVGENPFILDDQHSALIVPPSDPAALATALTRMLREKDLASRLGEAAHVRFEQELTVEHMVARYEQLYRELVEPSH